jgi:anti-sigma B factor antagonist
MDITISELKRVTLVEISGRVDGVNAPELGEALNTSIDAGHSRIVLDLSGVEYMSSAGLREMVAALKRARKGMGDLCLANPSERVREVLELAGLDTVFQVHPSQVKAVGSF